MYGVEGLHIAVIAAIHGVVVIRGSKDPAGGQLDGLLLVLLPLLSSFVGHNQGSVPQGIEPVSCEESLTLQQPGLDLWAITQTRI